MVGKVVNLLRREVWRYAIRRANARRFLVFQDASVEADLLVFAHVLVLAQKGKSANNFESAGQ